MLATDPMNTNPLIKRTTRTVWPLPHQVGLNPSVLGRGVTDAERLVVELGYEGADLRRRSFVPVFAVQDGTIAHVEAIGAGSSITLDHGRWFTHYSVLEHVFVMKRSHSTGRRERVRAGDILGYVRWPAHLRFELWQFDDDGELVPVDPEPHLKRWLVLPDLDQPMRTRAIAA